MPDVDVCDIILSSAFVETLIVRRRVEVVNSYGESVIASSDTAVYGAVQAGSQPEFTRTPDGQEQPNIISVHTLFRLVGPAQGHQPDVILWRNRAYVVTRTYDYSHYGNGFVSADCASLDYLDSV